MKDSDQDLTVWFKMADNRHYYIALVGRASNDFIRSWLVKLSKNNVLCFLLRKSSFAPFQSVITSLIHRKWKPRYPIVKDANDTCVYESIQDGEQNSTILLARNSADSTCKAKCSWYTWKVERFKVTKCRKVLLEPKPEINVPVQHISHKRNTDKDLEMRSITSISNC